MHAAANFPAGVGLPEPSGLAIATNPAMLGPRVGKLGGDITLAELTNTWPLLQPPRLLLGACVGRCGR